MNRKTTLLFLCISYVLTSCSKDTDSKLAQTNTIFKFSEIGIEKASEIINSCLLDASLIAKINGAEMITDDHGATLETKHHAVILKASNEKEGTTLIFPVNIIPGEHLLSEQGKYNASYNNNDKKYPALSGKLTIKDHSIDTKCIIGSFEFKTTNDIVVSEGFFEFGY